MSQTTIEAIALALTTLGSAVGLGWYVRSALADHETRDAERHEQNLERFRLVSIALARLGYKNGNA
jgi:hypothetical protein